MQQDFSRLHRKGREGLRKEREVGCIYSAELRAILPSFVDKITGQGSYHITAIIPKNLFTTFEQSLNQGQCPPRRENISLGALEG